MITESLIGLVACLPIDSRSSLRHFGMLESYGCVTVSWDNHIEIRVDASHPNSPRADSATMPLRPLQVSVSLHELQNAK